MLKISNEACVVFPYVSDKAVVDFINGLSVAGELNTIQKNRQDLVFRILDGLSGKSTMRQNHINDHLIAGLKICRSLIYEFSQDIQKHGIALLHLNQSMTKVQNNIAFIADYVADIKENLRCMNSDLMDLRRELEEHKTLFFAEQQMSRLMDKWEAEKFEGLTPIGRCYAVLDALYWGAFGHYLRLDKNKDTQEFIEHLHDKIIIRLKKDFQVNSDQDFLLEDWLRPSEKSNDELQQILAYQGDWCLVQPSTYETTFTATQWPALDDDLRKQYQNIPFRMMDIQRVSQRMIRDRFEQ